MNANFKLNRSATKQSVPHVPASIIRTVVLATFFGSLIFSGAVHAAPADMSGQPQNTEDKMVPMTPAKKNHWQENRGPEARERQLEERIKSLHKKLDITTEQEAKWNDVAQTMRDNEAAIDKLIQARHQNTESMTAIDDLQSYEDVTQAHADGIKKLIPVFQALYADMSDDQKKDADAVFSHFEGHGGKKHMKHHG
jgi:TolA-binding protein